MRKFLNFTLILFFALTTQAQITYEKGYFINNNNTKTACLIKNLDWKNNPTEFEYKLEETGNSKKQNINDIKEFGVYSISKYKRFTVKMDTSAIHLEELSTLRNPQFKELTIFLKTLIEGKANLYFFQDGNTRKYFFDSDNHSIQELIYKQFRSSYNKFGINELYKLQLSTYLKCDGITKEQIKKINYNKSELIKFFKKYNLCENSEIVNYNANDKKRDLFNLRIRPGITYSSLDISNSLKSQHAIDYDSEIGFRFGIEIESILPFNKNKWSIFVEPTYQYYKTSSESNSGLSEVDYSSVEIPLGVRHYFFLKNKSKIFLNAAYVFDLPINQDIDFEKTQSLKISTINNLTVGVGYDYKSKFNIELRYGFTREVLNPYVYWSSNYTSASLIFGYTLF